MGLLGGNPYIGRPMQSPQPEIALDDIEVPLYIEPFKSWRTWGIDIQSSSVQLKSITYKIKWPHKKVMRAHCLLQWRNRNKKTHPYENVNPHGVHSAPNLKHGCGIYSTRVRKDVSLWHPSTTELRVVGEVKIWGKTLCFKKGFVSEFAYPTCIFVDPSSWTRLHANHKVDITPHELMNELAESYDVPVVIE